VLPSAMDKKIPAIVVAAALAAEAVLPRHDAAIQQPHTELNVPPQVPGHDSSPSGGGGGRAISATLKLIASEDLLVMPHTEQKLSISEIRAEAEKTWAPPLPTGGEIRQLS
jgi:hypothetical protein